MSGKPIFVATHPRACSTAFERVFMTQRETIQCVHEPFGDAFYYGPERLSSRFAGDEHAKARLDSGFANSRYSTVMERLERETTQGKRVFIKDIDHYLLPPNGQPASIAPSLLRLKRGVGTNGESHKANGVNGANGTVSTNGNGDPNGVNGHINSMINSHTNGTSKEPYPYDTSTEPGNPTVMPRELQEGFHWAFLIRDPHYSVPSYLRCTIPPLDEVTGFHNYDPLEAGYDELRRHFDYLRETGLVGPHVATRPELTASPGAQATTGVEVCVIDADDMLDEPVKTIEAFCNSTGLPYRPEMLTWDTEEDHSVARNAFEKWRGFHNDAIESKALVQRAPNRTIKSEEEYDAEWQKKYGEKQAALIRQTVDANMADYLYLKSFAMKV
ncbi:P-loop containing nucleoside triphosphate hydrolase protein [Penicillium digitatum]|uniref:P-loop containing nucleoside triphosphate hydrolase protein n=3 Tax=Penicillium digitatum TaxID=36651 RepID=K9FW32_PEND2|nr:hypothetical protein PDIP_05630 [Penicillium digitatum Pd1]EKV13840.1 hypothetical protein PDIG_35840 [Penicillium digitatum PHI26]EKV21519.1 hypothetical protein PDIP_05630 [Penicillium digitatum Pd1]KAG0158384.1 hypothetical protein PDIDSM_5898 [Penicillium digitatum]QQK42132.1 P-loop containing nucleoside triphosphate hydrolase protein [Penicillium digitatum]